jgi:hypothetical protein
MGVIGINKDLRKSGPPHAEAASQSETLPALRSRAHGFPITKIVGNRQEGYQVTLRNNYDKSIAAFQLGAGRGRMTRDLLQQGKTIEPGAFHTEYYGYEEVLDKEPLTLFGAVFEDGSGAGQRDAVKAIKDMRLGAKMQLAQFTPILESALKSVKAGSLEVLDTLLSKTSALPSDAVDGLPPYVKFGFHNEKQRLLSEIQHIKSMQGDSGSLQTEDHIVKHLLKFKADTEAKNMRLANPLIQ